MRDAPLIITADVVAQLHALREHAAARPVDIQRTMRLLKRQEGRRRHKARMTEQTVRIPGPWDFFVTYSLETGHPVGTCRHMSISIKREGRVPHPAAAWTVAEMLGFLGGLKTCQVWVADLSDGGKAINIAQPISMLKAGHA